MQSLDIVKDYIINNIIPDLENTKTYDIFFEKLIKDYINDPVFKNLCSITIEDTNLILYIKPLDTFIKYEYCSETGNLNGVYTTNPTPYINSTPLYFEDKNTKIV